jgi:hypothetical protein
MNDPLKMIMQASGFKVLPATEGYQTRDHTELVFRVLRRIGVPENRLPEFANKVARAGHAAGPRDIATENRVSAKDIEGAIGDIEAGLRLLNQGLHTIGLARSTTTPNSIDRSENLAVIHAALIGAIADATASGIGAGSGLDEEIAASIPEYGPGAFRNPWAGVFSMAADRVKRIGDAFPRASYRATRRDRSEWLGRLIPELGKIYEEATGKHAIIYNPGEKAGKDWRCPFGRFVEDLWGYLDPTDGPCPGDDRINVALTRPTATLKTT